MRLLFAVLGGLVTLIVLPITIFIGYSVAGPFFEVMGGESYAVFGGMSGNSAISFKGALVLVGMSMIAVPAALILFVFFSGDSRGRRQPRAGGPRRRQ